MKPEKPLLTFVVDTREQWAYNLGSPKRKEFADGGSINYGLDAGDYSCEMDGKLLPVRIERKMLGDYYGVVGKGRERFERELEKLKGYRSYILIEATAQQVRAGFERSMVPGEAAFGSAICWMTKYNVPVVFGGDRRTSQEICRRILEEFALHHHLGKD